MTHRNTATTSRKSHPARVERAEVEREGRRNTAPDDQPAMPARSVGDQKRVTRVSALGMLAVLSAIGFLSTGCALNPLPDLEAFAPELQLTHDPRGHILTNTAVWSRDGRWIVYDTRSDPAGDHFDGSTIERVDAETGEVQVLYRSVRGAHCGVATCSPTEDQAVFILGPEDPTPDWQYSSSHRQGVIVDFNRPLVATNLDARDLLPPFTAGALRGGSHLHVFSGDGQWVSFTYEDAVLPPSPPTTAAAALDHAVSQRNIGVSVPLGPVLTNRAHLRNHDGDFFSVLVTRTTSRPRPGSDEISRAFEEAWVGSRGYLRADGTRQQRAMAFQGNVVTAEGAKLTEAFIVELPQDVTAPGDGPLRGTAARAPSPPRGTRQRRLTFSAGRKFPGIQGPRHWLRSCPDGSKIAMLMKDDAGVVQLWTVSPNGGAITQVTQHGESVVSAFSWSPDGDEIAYVRGTQVVVTEVRTGVSRPITPAFPTASAPRPEACIFSPDGTRVAYVRPVEIGGETYNQICVAAVRP